MSKEFFDVMEDIVKVANRIKFWEGAHSELYAQNQADVVVILSSLQAVENRVKKELKKKAKSKK
jgi:hypothetical protein